MWTLPHARVIEAAGATSNFLGYYGFPAVSCVSVNDEVVHGIPGPRVIEDGDIVSVDCGAIIDGWHGDSAVSVIVGTPRGGQDAHLVEQTRRSAVGGNRRARDRSAFGRRRGGDRRRCRRRATPPARGYVGHGIGTAMHQAPTYRTIAPGDATPR